MKAAAWLVGLCSVNAFAFSPPPSVIYGRDDRLDLYEVTNSRDIQLAASTVALLEGEKLKADGNRFKIAAETFGERFSLCEKERFFSQPSGAFCSGSLVGPDLLITAGHCITNADDCASTKFVFGYAVTRENVFPTSAAAEDVVGCKEIVARKQVDSGADFALIRLDRKVVNHPPLRINRLPDLQAGDAVGVIGHPSGLPVKVAFGESAVRSVDPTGYFTTNLDTYGGNSGSAVFNAKTGLIEGILVRGENDFVDGGGCRLSNVCPASGCRGEDVTKIGELAALIPEVEAPHRPGSSWPSLPRPRR